MGRLRIMDGRQKFVEIKERSKEESITFILACAWEVWII